MTDFKHRVWYPVKEYESCYEINLDGDVRRKETKKVLRYLKHYNVYPVVKLTDLANGKRKAERVHRLLAKTFIPNPNNKPYINHIDNNTKNNKLINLEWCTQQENLAHARKQGRMYSRPKTTPEDL